MSVVGMVLKEAEKVEKQQEQQQQQQRYDDRTETTNQQYGWDHWAIMPCHDKKLEASRRDFFISGNVKEQCVDLVITTQECVELVEEWINSQQQQQRQQQQQELSRQLLPSGDAKIDVATYLASLSPSEISTSVLEPKALPIEATRVIGTDQSLLVTTPPIHHNDNGHNTNDETKKQMAFSSGGHANFIFLYSAKALFDCSLDSVEWSSASISTTNKIRSARLSKQQKQHYYEAKLYRHSNGTYSCNKDVSDGDGDVHSSSLVLHFAVAHGMQTMQRALQQVERSTDTNSNITLHYLEAMACPHGCVNGGGSVRSSSVAGTITTTTATRETPSETRNRVQKTIGYLVVPDDSVIASQQDPSLEYNLPRTRYHVVPPMQHTMGAVAGEKVENMLW
jgi:iron only hydrogenase large subunit-like protein